jgi:hypothetical protein
MQFEIMPMPVLVGAFTKNFLIFFPAPRGIVKLVGSVKMFYPGNVHHRFTQNFGKGKPYLLKFET